MIPKTPWRIDTSQAQPRIVDTEGIPVVDPIANEDGMDDDVREWIVACVNACEGYPTEVLEQYVRSLFPIQFDCPDGYLEGQARAWRTVWEELWNSGMSSFLPDPIMGTGTQRAVQFIQHLKKEASK
jgi:hypothetical protein